LGGPLGRVEGPPARVAGPPARVEGPRERVAPLLAHTERLAVMSFARLDPGRSGSVPGTDVDEVTRARGYELLAHELAHTFDLHHCDHFVCVMNGIADEQELDDLAAGDPMVP
jgi:hypothetical protein